MRYLRACRNVLLGLAVMEFGLPWSAYGEGPATTPQPRIVDVALGEGGLLLGQVVDPQGLPMAKAAVSVQTLDREIASAATDGNGYFAVRGLRGGTYRLTAVQGTGLYRFWAPGTAPQTSQRGALLVAGQDLARGNDGSRLRAFMSSPAAITAGIIAGVGVPVGIHLGDRPASP